jgi:hypothetical protein
VKKIDFSASRLLIIYAQELYWLCHQIHLKSEELFKKYPILSNEVYISAEISGLDLIYSILSCAAKVQELIFSNKKKKLHGDRAKYLQRLLQPLNIKEILNKKVRNTIEHFGEYLDKVNKKHTLFIAPRRYAVAFNLVISHWKRIDDPEFPFPLYQTPQLAFSLYPVRVYVSSERTFYNMDWSIDLAALNEEAVCIKEHLISQKVLKEKKPENWISVMVICECKMTST